jgi:hypothetical protein
VLRAQLCLGEIELGRRLYEGVMKALAETGTTVPSEEIDRACPIELNRGLLTSSRVVGRLRSLKQKVKSVAIDQYYSPNTSNSLPFSTVAERVGLKSALRRKETGSAASSDLIIPGLG